MARARRGPFGRRKYSPVKPLLRPRAAIRWELSAKEGEAGTRRTALTGGAGLTAHVEPQTDWGTPNATIRFQNVKSAHFTSKTSQAPRALKCARTRARALILALATAPLNN